MGVWLLWSGGARAGEASKKDACPDEGLPRFTQTGPVTYDVQLAPPGAADLACRAEPRIAPVFRGGVQVGFLLGRPWPCSRFARAGLREGDILLRINGYVLRSPDEVLRIYARLKDATELRLEIERDGALLQLTYRLRRSSSR